MKLRLFFPLALAIMSVETFSQGTTYIDPSELPDLIKCLPAPPDSMSAAFNYDMSRYIWGKSMRSDTARVAMVKRDAVWTIDALLSSFSEAFGMEITKEGTPEIYKLLENSILTADPMRKAPKAYYNRKRPFAYFGDAPLSADDEEFRNEGSYPSGHTMRGWLAALILADINPLRANEIYHRGWIYCENRVIAGAHWQSDIDVTRAGASIAFSALQLSGEYQKQLKKAQKEFKKLQ